MTTLLAVLVGGFAGAVARQELFSALQERVSTRFPVGILAVNLSGAFVIGLLYGLDIASRWPDWLATGAETGLIGAYTTYSTWAVDSLALIRRGANRSAVVNLVGSLAAGVPLAWAGASLGAALLVGVAPGGCLRWWPGGRKHKRLNAARRTCSRAHSAQDGGRGNSSTMLR